MRRLTHLDWPGVRQVCVDRRVEQKGSVSMETATLHQRMGRETSANC